MTPRAAPTTMRQEPGMKALGRDLVKVSTWRHRHSAPDGWSSGLQPDFRALHPTLLYDEAAAERSRS